MKLLCILCTLFPSFAYAEDYSTEEVQIVKTEEQLCTSTTCSVTNQYGEEIARIKVNSYEAPKYIPKMEVRSNTIINIHLSTNNEMLE